MEHFVIKQASLVRKGDFIKRKPEAKKVYQALGYCRFNKAYSFVDSEDICNVLYLKGTKDVVAEFTY
jgi:hypothetical protein